MGVHFRFYFVLPHLEVGDLGADALQIHDAKYFRELHGQYSRWGFHHTGPGFFYVYAIGEWILRDLLRLVPSAFNAHGIVGVLLQTGFFTWSLWILQQHFRLRLLTPVLLVLAAVHFGAVSYNVPDSVFSSIWAAHILVSAG